MARTKKKEKAGKTNANNEWRRGKEETRELLLTAALDLFAQKGYRGTSVRDLAAAAGVTTGGFYSNFKSKREIYIAIIDKITNTIEDIVGELTRETIDVMKTRGGIQMEYELLRAPIQRMFDEASQHEALLNILLREGLGNDPEFQREIDRVWERFILVLSAALQMYIDAGFAKPYDTELVARAVVPMSIAMGIYDARTKGSRREDIVIVLASMLHGGASQWAAWQDITNSMKGRSGGS